MVLLQHAADLKNFERYTSYDDCGVMVWQVVNKEVPPLAGSQQNWKAMA